MVSTGFPIILIAVGAAVLAFGKRLSVMGAAVGALLGVVLLRLLGATDPVLGLIIVVLLAVIGFFAAGFAKGIVNIVLLVIGALGGAAIVLAFLEIFQVPSGLLLWLTAILGGVVGLVLVRRFSDWAMIVLAGLIGGLLITRGLAIWLPFLQDSIWGTLLVVVLAGGGIAYQGGFLARRKAAKKAATPAPTAPAPATKQEPAPVAKQEPAPTAAANEPAAPDQGSTLPPPASN